MVTLLSTNIAAETPTLNVDHFLNMGNPMASSKGCGKIPGLAAGAGLSLGQDSSRTDHRGD